MREEEQEVSRMNSDFGKLSLGIRGHPSRMHKGTGLKAATGEISCHSNSTIKEEEFDSERDVQEKNSDSSGNKEGSGMYYPNSSGIRYDSGNQYYQSLIDDDTIRNQKRRESQQIPTMSFEDRKLPRTSMKSTSMAFVPKPKDNRTSSMPNIFQPFGNKDGNMDYYQFNSQAHHPGMMNYNARMVGPHSSHISQNNDYDVSSSTGVGGMGGYGQSNMPDYNYDERRNSGTTGGSSNLNKDGKMMGPNRNIPKQMKKMNTPQYHNKARRPSNTSNLTIPTNDKNVMEYKGQLVAFAKNQQGSKYLQRVLAKASPDILDFVVLEVGDHLHELMVDSYGNYFCQKLLQSSSSKQRLYLLGKISPHIFKIS